MQRLTTRWLRDR